MSADAIKLLKHKVFDKSKWMQLPRDVVIGHDVFGQTPAVCDDLKLGRSALLSPGRGTMGLAGERVQESVLAEQYGHPVPCRGDQHRVIKDAEKAAAGMDFLIGVGGGRVIDTAKIVWPTTSTSSSSLSRRRRPMTASRQPGPRSPWRKAIRRLRPSLPSPSLPIPGSSPPLPTGSSLPGCADVISNYTAILDWELAHRVKGEPMSEYAIALSKMTAEILVKNAHLIKPHQEQSAWFVIKALVSSGVAMSIAGSSRPASGGEHKFSHALDRLAPGEGAARRELRDRDDHLHVPPRGRLAQHPLVAKSIGAPVTPAEVGIDDAIAVEALLMAKTIRPERFTIFDMGLTRESAETPRADALQGVR